MPERVRLELEDSFIREEVPAGTLIVRAGDPADRYYLVEAGEVEVWAPKNDAAGSAPAPGESWQPAPDSERLVGLLGPGDGFGEMALLHGGGRVASIRAAADTVVRFLDRETFEQVVGEYPSLLSGLEAEVAIRQASNFLADDSPFAGQPPELLRWLGLRMQLMEFAPGEEIVRVGEPADGFYVLRRGRVAVLGQREDGSVYRIAELGAGKPFGEQALLSDGPRTATVRALEPVEVLRLAKEDFEEVLLRFRDRAAYLFVLTHQRSRPRRAPDVLVTPLPGRSDAYVLKNIRSYHYARLSESGLFLWELMDGEHTVRDLSIAYLQRFQQIGVDVVLQTIVELHLAGFVDIPAVSPRLLRAAAAPNSLQRLVLTVEPWVRHNISLPDSDPLLGILYRRLFKACYWPPIQLLMLAVVITGVILYLRTLFGGHAGGLDAGGLALATLVATLINMPVHELAHAMTTKHFGREVHSAGLGWYLFMPVAFVDTSDMWLEGRRPRVAVAAAGPAANLLLAGIAACLLPLVTLGGQTHELLFTLATTSYLLALLNLNPLYELDGYYILSDWLDIPNLRGKALAFLGALSRREAPPRANPRDRRVFVFYGIAAALYAIFMAALIVLVYNRLLKHLLEGALPTILAAAVGWLLAGTMTILLLLNLWRGLQGQRRSTATAAQAPTARLRYLWPLAAIVVAFVGIILGIVLTQ